MFPTSAKCFLRRDSNVKSMVTLLVLVSVPVVLASAAAEPPIHEQHGGAQQNYVYDDQYENAGGYEQHYGEHHQQADGSTPPDPNSDINRRQASKYDYLAAYDQAAALRPYLDSYGSQVAQSRTGDLDDPGVITGALAVLALIGAALVAVTANSERENLQDEIDTLTTDLATAQASIKSLETTVMTTQSDLATQAASTTINTSRTTKNCAVIARLGAIGTIPVVAGLTQNTVNAINAAITLAAASPC